MVTEIAQLEIKPGSEAAFEAALTKIADLPRSKGLMASNCIGQSRNHSGIVSTPSGTVWWTTMRFAHRPCLPNIRPWWVPTLRQCRRWSTLRPSAFSGLGLFRWLG